MTKGFYATRPSHITPSPFADAPPRCGGWMCPRSLLTFVPGERRERWEREGRDEVGMAAATDGDCAWQHALWREVFPAVMCPPGTRFQ
jgi:hypothetical protein